MIERGSKGLFPMLIAALATVWSLCSAGPSAADPTPPAPADPLTAVIHTGDVERFAKVFEASGGHPSAEQLQKDYLDGASYGVGVFTPNRIVSADHLAAAVRKDPDRYSRAIHDCLPRIAAANADLHAIYLALHGLLPDKPLPQIYLVIGAGNSGGTAGPGAQVLGLEVLCTENPDADGLRASLRRFFAHETVHTFQHQPGQAERNPLLAEALLEGGADFIAELVTGQTPEPNRAAWAAPRERALWAQFQSDMEANRPGAAKQAPAAADAAANRWLENYGKAPEGWPSELGYWIGMRIWESYFALSPTKQQAIHDVLDWDDPDLILRRSAFPDKPQ